MKKILLVFFLFYNVLLVSAQVAKLKLKQPLSTKDTDYFIKEALKYLYPGGQFQIAVLANDLSLTKPKSKPEKLVTLEGIEALKKQLKGDTSDVGVYNQIGDQYVKLYKSAEARYYFEQAATLLLKKIELQPQK